MEKTRNLCNVEQSTGSSISGDQYDDVVAASVPERFRGTASDRDDMRVLGKQQVLRYAKPWPEGIIGASYKLLPA